MFRCAARVWSRLMGTCAKTPGRPQAPRCPSSLRGASPSGGAPRCGLDHGSGQCTPDPDTKDQFPVPQTWPLINPGASAIVPSMITLPSITALQQLLPPPPPLDLSSWWSPTQSHSTSSGPTGATVSIFASWNLSLPSTMKVYLVVASPANFRPLTC